MRVVWPRLRRPSRLLSPPTPLVLLCALQAANILWSAGVPGKAAAAELVGRLNAAGMPTLDISDIDAAQARARCWSRALAAWGTAASGLGQLGGA